MDHLNWNLDNWLLLECLHFEDSLAICFHHLCTHCQYMLLLDTFLLFPVLLHLCLGLNRFLVLPAHKPLMYLLYQFLSHLSFLEFFPFHLLVRYHILLLFLPIPDCRYRKILLFAKLNCYMGKIFLCLHLYLFLKLYCLPPSTVWALCSDFYRLFLQWSLLLFFCSLFLAHLRISDWIIASILLLLFLFHYLECLQDWLLLFQHCYLLPIPPFRSSHK